MPAADIVIQGAREHNLRSVDLVLPRNKLICLTGVSGSGKSSLAFDTLYAEGQRRYVESLSTFARQFLGQMPKPEVEHISGLSPAISISQKSTGHNPRSTVGTITEIYDYLRVLYARTGQGHCPECGQPITAQSREQIVARIAALAEGTKFSILAPLVRRQKGEFRDLFDDLLKQGFARARVDGRIVSLSDNLRLDRQMRHDIEVVVDRLVSGPKARSRLAEAVELALKVGDGHLVVAEEEPTEARKPPRPVLSRKGDEGLTAAARKASSRTPPSSPPIEDMQLSAHYACTHCGLSFEPPSPQLFSFNSPQGMCLGCDGLGEVYSFDPERLIPNPQLSFQQGCFELIGRWNDLGRWRRHIYQGVGDTLEYQHGLAAGTLLETAWQDLDPKWQDKLLWGTGSQHITFTWRHGSGVHKYGGRFEGIIPDLMSKHRQTKSRMQRRQLEKYMSVVGCSQCHGERLNRQARAVTISSAHPDFGDSSRRTLPQVCSLAVGDAAKFFSPLQLDATRQMIAAEVLKEIRARLGFLLNVGLEYLALDRAAPTLAGGESQRIRLAGQIGSGLVGVLYILDEPSIGLHPRDNRRLLDTLEHLRDMGNTVVVVEHDEETIRSADHVVDFGPGAGVRGGHIVASGAVDALCREPRSVTGQFLNGSARIEVPPKRRAIGRERLRVVGASHNNLKQIDVEVPLGMFVCVTGVSGSGKSSLVADILAEVLMRDLNRGTGNPGAYERIEGLEHLDKLISIDQSPIGRTPRSNPATYIKLLDEIRDLFTRLPQSKTRGYKAGRFSFNVSGGRCEACEGNGSNRLEMDFLADMWVTCPVCEGRRFNRETLQVQFKGKSIADVLDMDVQQALEHFENVPSVRHKLQTLHDVGLDYLKLGQPSPTLSGGEAQRIKLARELVKKSTGKTLYLLDEPTTGLHFADIRMLLDVLHGFVDAGNTVLVVEHNLDVVKTADWVIDLGPEGGEAGGRLVSAGTPEEIVACSDSHTGRALASVLNGHAAARHQKKSDLSRRPTPAESTQFIKVQGARQHNLKGIDVEIPRDQITVCCGVSGSGKTSLALDTIYAEGQRRYVESLSAYARQFVNQMQKPQLDHISGLSPSVAIEQKNMGSTPRSTVGTVTEIYDYLRILYARIGRPYCPACDVPIGTQSADEIIDKIQSLEPGTRIYLLAPLAVHVGERYETLWEEISAAGYVRVRIDGQTHSLEQPPAIDRRRKHDVEVVVDRVTVRAGGRSRLADSVESALALGRGVIQVAHVSDHVPEPKWRRDIHSQHYACDRCGRSFEPLTPHSFSFNSSLGWCPSCEGLGTQLGANPAMLLQDPKLSIAGGAIRLFPTGNAMLARMLAALSSHTGMPLDVPYEQLSARHRRMLLRGLADEWIAVPAETKKGSGTRPAFRFQYKGLYPALEEASRLSPSFRSRSEHLIDEVECSTCAGARLRDDAAAVRLADRTIDQLCRLPLAELLAWLEDWKPTPSQRKVAGELLREIKNRLRFLVDVGLDYLTLSRAAPTLSGGESQRIRLASQVGSGLTGVLYVLDEPTIGLHPRDNRRLLAALQKLRDLGNTLLLVEHDREVVASADQLLDFGPGAGREGGTIVARGTPAQIATAKSSVTGPYLSRMKSIPIPNRRRSHDGWLEVVGARHHNLKEIDVAFPLGTLVAVTGVSGSGKSSLVDDVLYGALARHLHRAQTTPGAHEAIRGLEQINKVIRVDQQPLGNTPTSNPATYTGVFELIRTLFAQLPEAKLRGYSPRRFSFNVPGGRCESCEGNGQIRVEMHFLPDVWVECETCRGRRYEPETLAVHYRGHNIAEVLEMPCSGAVELFQNIPKIRRILETLCDVGLGYLTLGQPAPTLSGGEAQRVKLAAELARPDTGNTLYLLDEPTTGLHFDDLVKLLDVLQRLVDLGNTVVVIEHNLDVIKTADWIIDLGPEAGEHGGYVVAAGTPEAIVAPARKRGRKAANGQPGETRRKNPSSPRGRGQGEGARRTDSAPYQSTMRSYTAELLAPVLKAGPYVERKQYNLLTARTRRAGELDITEIGRDAKMPWQIDGRRWHTRDRVARGGQPCRWDGAILERLVDRIQELGPFKPTNFDSRTIVEIAGTSNSAGWFFHAITGDPWLLELKFRVPKNTFRREELVAQLDLKPLNEMHDLPVYGSEPRVSCRALRGPWQEIRMRVHALSEISTSAFDRFLEMAVAGFQKFAQRVRQDPEEIMPWRVLGRKWHLSRKGFPPGKRVAWDVDVLESLCNLLTSAARDGEFVWNQQQVVHFHVHGQSDPWASIFTKRRASLDLVLSGPKGSITLGRVAELGADRELHTERSDKEMLKLQFRHHDDLRRGDLKTFLTEHLRAINGKP